MLDKKSKLTIWYNKHLGVHNMVIFLVTSLLTVLTLVVTCNQNGKLIEEQEQANSIGKNSSETLLKQNEEELIKSKNEILDIYYKKDINANDKVISINHSLDGMMNVINRYRYYEFLFSILQLIKLPGITVNNLNIDSAKLTNYSFDNISFRGLTMKEVELDNIGFRDCKFNNSTFKIGEFKVVLFDSCTIEDCKWDSILHVSCTYHSNFSNSNFTNIDASWCDFSKSNLAGTRFQGRFEGTNFSNCDLREANFKSSRISSADFTNSDLRMADFDSANLKPKVELALSIVGHEMGEKDTIELSASNEKLKDEKNGFSLKDMVTPNGLPIFKNAKLGYVKWINGREFPKDTIGVK